jgi:signal peptidase II
MSAQKQDTFRSRKLQLLISFFILAFLVLLDQGTKLLAAAYLKGQPGIPLIDQVLELHYLYPENRGIAFGMFQGKTGLFAIVNVLLFAGILWFYLKIPQKRYYIPLMAVCLLLLSGAFGNLIDRFYRGYVIDFIYFSLIDFPVFNVADIYVVSAGILLILLTLFKYKQEHDFDFISTGRNKQ